MKKFGLSVSNPKTWKEAAEWKRQKLKRNHYVFGTLETTKPSQTEQVPTQTCKANAWIGQAEVQLPCCLVQAYLQKTAEPQTEEIPIDQNSTIIIYLFFPWAVRQMWTIQLIEWSLINVLKLFGAWLTTQIMLFWTRITLRLIDYSFGFDLLYCLVYSFFLFSIVHHKNVPWFTQSLINFYLWVILSCA